MSTLELLILKRDALDVIAYWFSHPPQTTEEHDKCAAALFRAQAAHEAACRELQDVDETVGREPAWDGITQAILGLTRWLGEHPADASWIDPIVRQLRDSLIEGGVA